VKRANIRLYLDADVLGLAKILVLLRSDVTFPGDRGGVLHKRQRPPCPITSPHVDDQKWIPEDSRQGWLVVTRDTAIQYNRAEIAAVRDSGARMVALSGAEAGTTWAQLEIVMCQWRRIEALLDEPGPFIYAATRTALRPVPLG
jgi:hypothetical protein